MNLDVRDLSLGPFGRQEEISVELFKEIIDEGLTAERVKGKIKLTKLESEIMLNFEGEAKVRLLCDRCLADAQTQIMLRFNQGYSLSGAQAKEDQFAVNKNFTIDLIEPIRQEIITKIPVKNLCKKNCAGICPNCGKNLNLEKCTCKSKVKMSNDKS